MKVFPDMRILLCLVLAVAHAFGAEVSLTVLATTDLHGNIYPYDYLAGQPSPRGLAKILKVLHAF